jgi:hypothetical protein
MRFFVQPDAPTIIEQHVGRICILHFRNPTFSSTANTLLPRSTRSSVYSTPRQFSCGRTICALTTAPGRGSKTTSSPPSRGT